MEVDDDGNGNGMRENEFGDEEAVFFEHEGVFWGVRKLK